MYVYGQYGGIQLTFQYTIISITLRLLLLVRETWNDYIPNFTMSKVELKLMQL
jgi:hypothetical protein